MLTRFATGSVGVQRDNEPLLHELVERRVTATPDAVAVVQGRTSVSYAALDRRANQWARRLRAAGAGPDVLVGVHLDRTTEMVAVLLGVLKAGAGYVPLDTAYPRERLELMADDAAMPLVVSAEPDLTLRTRRPVVVLTPDECDRDGPACRVRGGAVADNVAYVLYTSGSTGRPKGAALTHRNGTDLVLRVAETFGDDLDRVLAATSISFDCSMIEIFGALCHGGTVVLAETAMDIGTRNDGHGVRLLHTVPSVVDELLRTDRLPSSTRTAIVGGERLLPGVVERIYANSSIERLVNIYGPVECATYVTLAEVRRTAAGPPAIGRPATGARIHLCDRAGRLAEAGSPGEVYVGGPMLARGYLHRPSATAERFGPDPFGALPGQRLYRVGDLAYHDEAGELHFLGRVDDQIKVRGVRVEPSEVEGALLRHPAVVEAAVVGSTRLLTAFLVTSEPVAVAALRAFVGTCLPRPLRPDTYVMLDRLPRMPNGKVDRRQLATTAADEPPGCGAVLGSAAPRTALESTLARLWATALDRDDIGVDDNVFDLGGHSLIVLGVRARLNTELGAELPVRLFFEHPTISALAKELERLGDVEPGGAAPVYPATGTRPAPLSVNQRAIMARVRTRAGDPGLVFPLVVRLAGSLAPHALAAACTELARRHESLRTRIVDGVQHALAPRPVTVPLVDLSGLAPRTAEVVAAKLVADLIARPFVLTEGPLARFGLVRLRADLHVFAVTTHHLVSDAWSVETLSHQLVDVYSANLHGRAPTAPRPCQYVDWAIAQLEWLASDAGRGQLAYWRAELANLPVLGLRDGRRRATVPGDAIMLSFHIGADLTDRIGVLARSAGATRFMVLLTAFAVLLARRTAQTDVAIGCPTPGRPRPELESVIGPCHDALVLRVDLSGAPTFGELLARVRSRALDAYSRQDLPFAVLVDELGGGGPEHPLFQAGIGFQERPSLLNYPYSRQLLGRADVGDVTLSGFSQVPLPPTALDVELALAVDPAEELEGVLTCRSDVIDEAEIHVLAENYHGILDAATAEPDSPVADLRPLMRGLF